MYTASPEHTQKLVERERHFRALKESPAWSSLEDALKEKMEAHYKTLAHKLMRGERVSMADAQWYRGFFAGARFVLRTPDFNDSELKKALEKQQREDDLV